MAERIGLTKNVLLDWMELAATCRLAGKTQKEAYPILNERINETIKSPVNVKQIRVILFNMWYRPEDWFLQACTKAAGGLSTNERIAIHWALLLKRYPVFYDISTVIGGLFNYRDEITLGQIRDRVFEKWGARDTLLNCLPKNIQTYKELKAVAATNKAGTYRRCITKLNDITVMQLLCEAIIDHSGKQYITWEELVHHPALFAFSIVNMTQADMASCDWLCLERMGEDIVIRVKG